MPTMELFLDAPPLAKKLPDGAVETQPGVGEGGELVSGTADVPLPENANELMTKRGIQTLHVAVQVCRDRGGVPSMVRVLQPVATPDFNAHYLDEISKWRYAPYLIDGKAVESCSVVSFDYSQKQLAEDGHLMVEGYRTVGDPHIRLSDETRRWMTARNISLLQIVVKLCIDKRGVPSYIEIMFPPHVSPEFVDHYWKNMKTWRYQPYVVDGAPVDVCTSVIFNYRLE